MDAGTGPALAGMRHGTRQFEAGWRVGQERGLGGVAIVFELLFHETKARGQAFALQAGDAGNRFVRRVRRGQCCDRMPAREVRALGAELPIFAQQMREHLQVAKPVTNR